MNSAKNKYIITTKYEIFLREKLRYSAQTRLSKKYDPPSCFYNVKIINDLIFNEETHLVVLFREYCTLENTNEYFRRFYFKEEIIHRMPKSFFSMINTQKYILIILRYLNQNTCIKT